MKTLQWWFVHLAVFVVAQSILAALGQSWPAAFLADRVPEETPILMDVSKWWLLIFSLDTVWSMYKTFSGEQASTGGG